MQIVQRHHNAWVVVSPAEDVPGEWLAHCLDLNIMSQGRSVRHALEMMLEAMLLVLEEDCRAGLNPLDRRAPDSDWKNFWDHVRSAELSSLEEVERDDTGTLPWMATQFMIQYPSADEPRVLQKPQVVVQHASAAA